MLSWLRRNSELRQTGHDLYERIVAQARHPAFYEAAQVPDTMEGRFEMIVLHLFLVLDRLKPEGAAGQKLGQRVMECLVADMDDALRQIGIGDMGVPRRIQKTAAAMSERLTDYASAVDSPLPALEEALARHVFGSVKVPTRSSNELARYARAARDHLRAVHSRALLASQISFPEPAPCLAEDSQRNPGGRP